MQNVIWSNDTDRIDSIIDYWKEEAARAAEDMAKDPKGAIDDAFWQVADILDRAWRHMEYETWSIDGHDDLRYTGVHHDGTNTCSVRELKEGRDIEPDDSLRDILRKTTPLGPRIRAVYGMPAPENPTKNVEKPPETT